MPLTWRALLDGDQAARAAAVVEEIADALAGWPEIPLSDPAGASLASGEAGLALFFSYLDRARPGRGYAELAEERLDRAVDRLATSFHQPGLFQGFTSIAWTVEHLRDRSEEDPGDEIDAALLDLLATSPWRDDYDLAAGLAGFGVYALERWPAPTAAACLARVCERLAESAVPQEVGLAWLTPDESLHPRERQGYPHGMVNLGVAHGVPGVLPVLAQAAAALGNAPPPPSAPPPAPGTTAPPLGAASPSLGATPPALGATAPALGATAPALGTPPPTLGTAHPARALLAAAVAGLLHRRLPAGGESVFPTAWGPAAEPAPARTAWCYGDPGIAAALWLAARAAGEPAWEAEALHLARTAARRAPERSGVRDACLCHGAAGLGHLFNRLGQATGDPELLAAARAWLARALDLREPGRGVAGFVTWGPDAAERMDWRDDPSLLTGAAGVGLALLAAATAVEPAWDRFLLLSPALPEMRSTPSP
jgi:lantibiotic modifying enzyme